MIGDFISALVPLWSKTIWLYNQLRGHILLWTFYCESHAWKTKQEQYVLQVASSHSFKLTISCLALSVMTRCVSRLSSFEVWDCVLPLSPQAICPPNLAFHVHPLSLFVNKKKQSYLGGLGTYNELKSYTTLCYLLRNRWHKYFYWFV